MNGNLLIVDDTPENIDVLVSLLEDYNLQVALSGEKAIDIASRETQPDLILLDIMMSGMSGFEVCAHLKADPSTKEIPIIFLTAMTDRENVVSGLKMGAQDYITKPFDMYELKARVETQMVIVRQKKALITMNQELEDKVEKRTRELFEAMQKAEIANRAKTMFLANINHELRTPMNGIIGFGKLLEDANLPEPYAGYLSVLNNSADNLLNVIHEIIEYTNIESTKKEINLTEFNVSDLIHQSVDFLEIQAIHKQLRVVRNFSDDKILVEGDNLKIKQIILSLISNAIKFTMEGKVEIKYSLEKMVGENAQLIVSIVDTGIGIPEEKFELIFDKFYMIDESFTRDFGGLGLGLSIAKELSEVIGARIEVESQVNSGSTFTLKIPVKLREIKNESPLEIPLEIGQKRILVVEDNPINFRLVNLLLTKEKHLVTLAEDGQIAVNKVKEEDFDLILMDIQMPVMDGLQATKEIRNKLMKPIQELPIVALTAHTSDEDLKLCIEAGMNGMINKPVRKDVLLATVVKYARKNQPE